MRRERERKGILTSIRMLRMRLAGRLEALEGRELVKLNAQAQSKKKHAQDAYLRLVEAANLRRRDIVDSPKVFGVSNSDKFSFDTWDWSIHVFLKELRTTMEIKMADDARVKPLCMWLARLKVFEEDWMVIKVQDSQGRKVKRTIPRYDVDLSQASLRGPGTL